MAELYYDVLIVIFKYLDWKSLSKTRRVCRLWKSVADSYTITDHAFEAVHPDRYSSCRSRLRLHYPKRSGFHLPPIYLSIRTNVKHVPPIWTWPVHIAAIKHTSRRAEEAARYYCRDLPVHERWRKRKYDLLVEP